MEPVPMPELTIENDPTIYSVELRQPDGTIARLELDVFELGFAVQQRGVTEEGIVPIEVMVAAVKEVGRPTDLAATLSDGKAYAIGSKVNFAFQQAGNAPGP
jgi:hypothetical protein